MSFRVLRYIVAAVSTGHFSEAARLCNVTQPSLSQRIRKLEDYLGVDLFHRTTRGVVPTDAGREIAQLAEEALRIEQRIKALGPRLRSPF